MNKLNIKNASSTLFKTGFFHVFFSTVLNKGITFLAGIILVRLLTKEMYGIYSYAFNLYSFIILFNGFGIPSSILQVCSENHSAEKKEKMYNYGCKAGLIFDVILMVTLIIIALFIPLPIKGTSFILLSLSVLPFFQFLSSMQVTRLRTELRNKEYSFSNNLSTISVSLFTIILCFFLQAYGRILALYLSSIITFLFVWKKYGVHINFRNSTIDKVDRNDIFKISGISMLNTGLSEIMYYIDIFTLGSMLADENEIAVYKVATIIPTALSFIPLAVVVYIYPYFAKNKDNPKWLRKCYMLTAGGLGVLNLIVGLICICFSREILLVIYGEEYLTALPCFRVLSLSFIFSGTFRILSGNLLVSQRKLFFNFLVSLISSIMNVILNIILIRELGTIGAAYATLITVIATGIASTSYLVYLFRDKKQVDKRENM